MHVKLNYIQIAMTMEICKAFDFAMNDLLANFTVQSLSSVLVEDPFIPRSSTHELKLAACLISLQNFQPVSQD